MSYIGIGVSPGHVAVINGSNTKVIDRRIKVAELVIRCVVCVFSVISAVLIRTDSQTKELFSIQKTAKFTDMRSLVILVVASGLVAAYSVVQGLRCVVSMVRGTSVVLNKSLAWAIFSADQLLWWPLLNLRCLQSLARQISSGWRYVTCTQNFVTKLLKVL